MACFLVPAGEAVVTTVVQKMVKKKEKEQQKGFKWTQRLGWLNRMLWGGVALLALEHIWHGEVVPWPPFLTAMKNPADIPPMLNEMAKVGTTMAVAVTCVWLLMVLVAEIIVAKSKKPVEEV
ncbi:MAG: hypothetical protein J7L42_04925 [Elusimicrobia bacterium]|nr:hypothetical protein [Elusimicrobiota bacterium]